MEKVMCKLMAYQAPGGSGMRGAVSILEDFPASDGKSSRLTVSRNLLAQFNFGDRIKSVSGTTAILVKPGTGARIFILTPQLPVNADGKYRTELEINEETTKTISRGKIGVSDDIGNISRAAGAFTR